MTEDEYLAHDAVGLAALIAKKEISAPEALEAALARAASVNPKLNAITMDLAERARREAALPAAGPLAGVPFLLKARGPPAPASSTRTTSPRPTARRRPFTAPRDW
jgi:amidase